MPDQIPVPQYPIFRTDEECLRLLKTGPRQAVVYLHGGMSWYGVPWQDSRHVTRALNAHGRNEVQYIVRARLK